MLIIIKLFFRQPIIVYCRKYSDFCVKFCVIKKTIWQLTVGERGELFALGFSKWIPLFYPLLPLNSCPPFVSRLVAIRLIVVVQQGSPFPAGKEKRAEIQSRIKRTKLSLVYNYLKVSVGEKKEFPTFLVP